MKPYDDTTLEADLRDAIDADDLEAIATLGAEVDRRQHRPAASLLAAALWYAEQGLKVFPLRPGMKAPLPRCDRCKARSCPGVEECGHDLCHGLKGATTDPAKITAWWTDVPARNIGIATGHLVDVIDIDGPAGVRSWVDLHDDLPQPLGKVATPRPGGNHLYVRAVAGRGNKAGIFPGVDYRGAGGYVVAPPSVIAPGGKDAPGQYAWYAPLQLEATLAGVA